MTTVWKFPIAVEDEQAVQMPFGAEILTVQVQGEQPCLWALVNPLNTPVPVRVITHGTGHNFGEVGRYIGTYQLQNGALVFHVFRGSHL